MKIWLFGPVHEKGDEEGNLMPGTLCSLWTGIDWDRVEKIPDVLKIERELISLMMQEGQTKE